MKKNMTISIPAPVARKGKNARVSIKHRDRKRLAKRGYTKHKARYA